MAQTLTDHVALITGSTTGLGFGIAKVLGQAGAKVIMNYYNDEERADRAFSEFKSLGCDGVLVRGNAIDESSVQEIVNTGESKFGPIDIIVPNATPDQPLKPIEEYDWSFYQQMLDLLMALLGVVFLYFVTPPETRPDSFLAKIIPEITWPLAVFFTINEKIHS